VVQFFTNLGRIDEQGKTNDGVARVNLISDSRSGTATVSAFSGGAATTPSNGASPGTGGSAGGASGSIQVIIGAAQAANVIVTAAPQRIVEEPRTSTIRAVVVDTNGNGISNVPVFFAITQGIAPSPSPTPSASPGVEPTPTPNPPPGDFLESRGRPVFTDNNGVAMDLLHVTTEPNAPQRTLTITATTSNGKTGSATVVIN
jgi:hypothetical protein